MSHTVLYLQGLSQVVRGQRWEVDRLCRIGRLPNLDIHIPDSSLSRVHAEVVLTERGWAVRDLGSTNGTYLNGERLGRADMLLGRQDSLQFGNVILTVADVVERPNGRPAPSTVDSHVTHEQPISWHDLPAAALVPAADPADAREWVRQLATFGRVYRSADSFESYLTTILWKAAETLNAPDGALLFIDDRLDAPRAEVSLSFGEGDGGRRDTYRTLIKDVLVSNKSRLLHERGPGGGRSTLCTLFKVEDRVTGALCLSRLAGQEPFTARDLQTADALALAAAPSIASYADLQDRQTKLFLKTLTVLSQLVQFRDDRAGNHGQRVTDYALLLAEQLGLSDDQTHLLRVGTPIHDLGKIGIRDEVLNKAGPLTPDEKAYVRDQIHTGAELVAQLPTLSGLVPIVRNSHERWDGDGYPDGLSGEGIPLLARVVAFADAFDAMTTDQPYRKPLPPSQALDEIKKRAGTQFDPACVQAFLALRPRLVELVLQRGGLTRTMSVRDMRQTLRHMEETGTIRRTVVG